MVGFHIDSIINQDCSHYPDISKESQTSNLQKSTKLKSKSDLIVYRSTSIDSVSSPKNHKVYQCVKCQKIFNLKSIYQNHMQSHGKDCKNVYRCNICGKSFTVPARLTRHYRTHTGEKPYQCEYCNKSFSVKENLSVHRRIHTKERPYKCDVCESAFEHSGKLHRHMRIHTGERPHKCSICTKTFIQSGQLVIHMRTHTGEKPYICKSCGKGFTCSKQLKVHTRTHTGEKPYKCDICGKSFGYNHVLKLHQVAHYGEKFYKCTLCEETFNSKKLMELHIKTHSESSFSNISAPNESSFITTHNINKISFCNNSNVNQIVPNNVNNEEINNTLCAEVRDTPKNLNCPHIDNYESFTLRICELHNKSDDEKVPEFLTDKSHSSTTTTTSNMCLHKDLNDLSLEKKLTEVIEDKLQISDQLSIVSEQNPVGSCSYEELNSDLFSKNYLPTFNSSNKTLHQNLEKHCDMIEERESESNKELKNCERFSITYRNSVNAPLYTNHNFLEQTVTDNFSLPPRKRCRMILESMEIENTKLMATKRYNSVIRFARADNANLANV